MIQPIYNIRHWFPCDKVVTSYDGWYNPAEYTDVRNLPENKGSVKQAPLFFLQSDDLNIFFKNGERKIFKIFLLCECGNEKLRRTLPPVPDAGVSSPLHVFARWRRCCRC